jgi:hypothetical protein
MPVISSLSVIYYPYMPFEHPEETDPLDLQHLEHESSARPPSEPQPLDKEKLDERTLQVYYTHRTTHRNGGSYEGPAFY